MPTLAARFPGAKAIWREIWSAPDAAARRRLKETDSTYVARYCVLRAKTDLLLTRFVGMEPTYEVTSTVGSTVTKSNPRFDAILNLMAILGGMEERMGLTPRSRIDIADRLADPNRGGKGAPTPLPGGLAPQAGATSSPAAQKPSSPIGLLAAPPAPTNSKH